MRILKWLAGAIGALVLLLVAVVIGARFADGPMAIIPGGPIRSRIRKATAPGHS